MGVSGSPKHDKSVLSALTKTSYIFPPRLWYNIICALPCLTAFVGTINAPSRVPFPWQENRGIDVMCIAVVGPMWQTLKVIRDEPMSDLCSIDLKSVCVPKI